MAGGEETEIWLDRFARRLGFGWLSDLLPGDTPPSYLYAVLTIGLSEALIAGYSLANEIPLIYEENPFFILQPVVLLGAVYGSRTLTRGYDRAMTEMNVAERATDPEPLLDPIPSWVPWAIFGVGATLQLVRASVALGAYGVTDIIANFVVFPFIFLPIVAQFFAVYVAIEFLAPRRLWRSDVGIHFFDPEGVGGLRPLGELVKKAYYFVAVGLVAYAMITYAPFVSTGWEVSQFANALFTGLWIGTIGTVGYAVFTLHRFMRREKRAEIQRLEAEIRELVTNPWDVAAYDVPDEERERVEDLRQRVERVSTTKEYPATFSIWSQLLLSIVLPKAIQRLLASA
jgi:hypothetical protein